MTTPKEEAAEAVAWARQRSLDRLEEHGMIIAIAGPGPDGGYTEPLYSQAYVLSLIAEVERLRAVVDKWDDEMNDRAASPREWPKPGDRMRFLDEGGYPSDLAEARKHFSKGEIATVRDFHLGDWNSTVAFEGVPGWFNSVMFEHFDS